MSKTALRYLSLGFLVSAIILAGYRAFLYDPQINADGTDSSAVKSSQEELMYKEKYEQLLAETEVATSENAADETDSEEETSSEVITTTIVIDEGQPSSVAATQLQNQGIIESASEFNDYLEENNLATQIRPGSFVVKSDMSFQEIADILISDN